MRQEFGLSSDLMRVFRNGRRLRWVDNTTTTATTPGHVLPRFFIRAAISSIKGQQCLPCAHFFHFLNFLGTSVNRREGLSLSFRILSFFTFCQDVMIIDRPRLSDGAPKTLE